LLQRFEIDVLINNAGIPSDAKVLKMTFQEWQSGFQTNLSDLYNATQAVAKVLVLRGNGALLILVQ
jgi:short-subunit dehydrogenase